MESQAGRAKDAQLYRRKFGQPFKLTFGEAMVMTESSALRMTQLLSSYVSFVIDLVLANLPLNVVFCCYALRDFDFIFYLPYIFLYSTSTQFHFALSTCRNTSITRTMMSHQPYLSKQEAG